MFCRPSARHPTCCRGQRPASASMTRVPTASALRRMGGAQGAGPVTSTPPDGTVLASAAAIMVRFGPIASVWSRRTSVTTPIVARIISLSVTRRRNGSSAMHSTTAAPRASSTIRQPRRGVSTGSVRVDGGRAGIMERP